METETASNFSEVSSQIHDNHQSFTCITCQVKFPTSELQRQHYRVAWHQYNLKRKIAGLKSITEEVFKEKVLAQQQKEKEEEENKTQTWSCSTCKKVFNSENAYKNHELSKKHIEAMTKSQESKTKNVNEVNGSQELGNKAPVPRINWKQRLADATTEEEYNKILDEKIKMSKKLEETECLFCSFKGNSYEEKFDHMVSEHTFFIPDSEFLIDQKGLIDYLSEKISIGNTCIYCDRTFQSLEAVQKHMIDKGHCIIRYDNDTDPEMSDYYDFSELFKGVEDEEDKSTIKQLQVSPEGSELILSNGVRIGHRDYRVYYNQNYSSIIKNENEKETEDGAVKGKHKVLAYNEIGSSGMTIEKERLEKFKEARILLGTYQFQKEKLGIQNMKLQKYQRKQVPILYIHKNL